MINLSLTCFAPVLLRSSSCFWSFFVISPRHHLHISVTHLLVSVTHPLDSCHIFVMTSSYLHRVSLHIFVTPLSHLWLYAFVLSTFYLIFFFISPSWYLHVSVTVYLWHAFVISLSISPSCRHNVVASRFIPSSWLAFIIFVMPHLHYTRIMSTKREK